MLELRSLVADVPRVLPFARTFLSKGTCLPGSPSLVSPHSRLTVTVLPPKMPATWPPFAKSSCGSSRSETLRKSPKYVPFSRLRSGTVLSCLSGVVDEDDCVHQTRQGAARHDRRQRVRYRQLRCVPFTHTRPASASANPTLVTQKSLITPPQRRLRSANSSSLFPPTRVFAVVFTPPSQKPLAACSRTPRNPSMPTHPSWLLVTSPRVSLLVYLARTSLSLSTKLDAIFLPLPTLPALLT